MKRSIVLLLWGLTALSGLLFFRLQPVSAFEWRRPEAHGEWVHGVRLSDCSEVVTSRAMLSLTSGWLGESLDGLLTLEAVENFRIPDDSDLRVREGYVTFRSQGWEARAGRQILIWGRADGVRIVDRLSPVDSRESVTRELEEIRLGVDSLRASRWLENGELEFIWIPRFHGGKYPGKDSPWWLGAGTGPEEEKPDGLDAMSLGLRLGHYASAFDFSLYALSAPMETAVIKETERKSYPRTLMLGADAAFPAGDAVWRLETAWFDGWWWNSGDGGLAVERDRWMVLAGCDLTLSGSRTLGFQAMGDWVPGATASMEQKAFSSLFTLNAEQKLFRERLKLSGFVYYDPSDSDVYARTVLDWEIRDGVRLALGLHLFEGQGKRFAPYRDHSQLWWKISMDW
ncbi:DUF1302 family protein [Desulfobotulus sp.]|uniref:DUF1302 family protein n=1 Tax=Desulfobotulus sp. TaxID=1940337 RepID=UPI002A36B1F3|nr:DUF1302 family protein [Desulfobotulus sp.]MDY0164821.1 hypothetical protein [Desulfobotulus sp.]